MVYTDFIKGGIEVKTVTEVSKLTGISVRTLHYYDEIGLLKPTIHSEAGYRLYDDKALETLQRILFFKEFDIPLKEIKSIMDNPNFDNDRTLINQQKILFLKRERIDGLIKLIDDILKGSNTMSFQEFSKEEIEVMFQSMLANMNKEQFEIMTKEYGDIEHFKSEFISNAGSEQAQKKFKKVIEWYGSKEEAINAVKNPASSETMQSYQNMTTEIIRKLCAIREKEPTSFEVKELVAEFENISKQIYQMKDVKTMLLELAKVHMENENLIKTYDEQYGKGSSMFIGKAFISFYQN